MRIGSITVAGLVFMASACAGETQERPVAPRAHHDEPAPLTMPDTAFADTHGTTVPMHFETRRIGEAPPPGRRYHGAPVDLDVKDADLHNVFRLLADVGNTNIVVAGEVGGTITLKLKRVPWDQALDVVVRAKGLYVEKDGNVLMVSAKAPTPPPDENTKK